MNLPADKVTMEIIKAVANYLDEMIQMTIDIPRNYIDRKVQMQDVKVWMKNDDKNKINILYKYFHCV